MPETIQTAPPTEPTPHLRAHREVSAMLLELGLPYRMRRNDRAGMALLMVQYGLWIEAA